MDGAAITQLKDRSAMKNHRRRGQGLTALLCLTVLSAPPASSQSPAPRFPGQVEQVTVDVVVLDKDGQPVTGLKAEDFTVYEDGKPQPIATFEAIQVPDAAPAAPSSLGRRRVSTNVSPPGPPERSFVIVVDTVHLSHTQAEQARASVADFIRNGLADGDRVHLTATGGGAWWSGRMPDARDDLIAALAGLKGLRAAPTGPDHVWDYEAQAIYVRRDQRIGAEVMRRWAENGVFQEYWSPGGGRGSRDLFVDLEEGHPLLRAKTAQVYKDSLSRQRITTRALERVLEALGTSRGRKTVLLVTEGFIYDQQEGGFARVTDAARRANAVIYFMDARLAQGSEASAAELGRAIDIRDIGTTLSRHQQEVTGAISVAVESGGERLGTAAALADNLRQVAALSRAYYLLGYHPANLARDGRFRKIKVEVNRPGVEVRSRRGYSRPREGDARGRDRADLDPEVQQALDSPFAVRGIPLRLASYVQGPAAEGKTRVVLLAEADIRSLSFRESGGRHRDVIQSFYLVTSRATGESQNYQGQLDLDLPAEVHGQLQKSWLPLSRAFDLAPGVYQARLALREKNGAALGSVTHEFEVEPPGRLRVTTPVITDALVAGAGGAPAQAAVIARRTFAPGSRVFVQFEVWAARAGADGRPQASSGHTLRGAGGVTLSAVEPAPLGASPQGTLGRIFALDLPPTASGELTLTLTVRDDVSGETVELQEPILVEGRPAAAASGSD
jgi:VWFA-related protein